MQGVRSNSLVRKRLAYKLGIDQRRYARRWPKPSTTTQRFQTTDSVAPVTSIFTRDDFRTSTTSFSTAQTAALSTHDDDTDFEKMVEDLRSVSRRWASMVTPFDDEEDGEKELISVSDTCGSSNNLAEESVAPLNLKAYPRIRVKSLLLNKTYTVLHHIGEELLISSDKEFRLRLPEYLRYNYTSMTGLRIRRVKSSEYKFGRLEVV